MSNKSGPFRMHTKRDFFLLSIVRQIQYLVKSNSMFLKQNSFSFSVDLHFT